MLLVLLSLMVDVVLSLCFLCALPDCSLAPPQAAAMPFNSPYFPYLNELVIRQGDSAGWVEVRSKEGELGPRLALYGGGQCSFRPQSL